MRRILNISNLYIFLWCIYSLQGLLYPIGSTISRSVLAILMLISIFYFININLRKEELPSVLKTLNILIIFFSIYGIVYMLFGENNILHTNKFEYLKGIYMSLLPIYPFYSFAQTGMLNEKAFKKWIPIFFIVAIACFYSSALTLNEYASTSYEYEGDFTNNSGYLVLSLLPATLLYQEKPIIQYSLLTLALYFIILGFKRGAILTAGICTIWIFYQLFKTTSAKGKVWIILFEILLLIMTILYIVYLSKSNDYFVERLEQTQLGNSSDRDWIYTTLFNYFMNGTTIFTFLLGSGANATINIAGNYAHNDWLEIAVNNGLIGIVIYVVYWISLFKTCRNAKLYPKYYLILTTFIIIVFMETLFSMSYNSQPIYITSVLAWVLASLQTTQSSIYDK